MKSTFNTLANLCALGAVALYAIAGVGKFTGQSSLVLGVHPASMVVAGLALMSLAIFAKVDARQR